MEQRAAISSLLHDAQVNAGTAALLLQRYVMTGDEALVPEIRSSTDTAVESLREAIALEDMQDDEDEPEELAKLRTIAAMSPLTGGVENIIALQQSGDVEAAAAALEEMEVPFRQLRLELADVTDHELGEAADLQSEADRTGDVAFWLLVISGAIGAGLGLAASTVIARSILRPLSSLEATAQAVANGDLEARAQTKGPRELAQLGASLNRMTESLLDASKRRELEAQLRQSEERCRSLIENALDMITVLGADGTIRFASPSAERVLGRRPEELIGKSAFELVHPDDLARLLEAHERAIRNPGTSQSVEFRFLHKDGSWRTVEAVGRSVVDDSGAVSVIANSRDVTERKQAEQELRESKQMLAEIAEGITDAIFLISKDFRILWANKAAVQQTGYKMEELIGSCCYKVSHLRETPCEPPLEPCPIYQLQKISEPVTVTHTHFDAKGNEILVEVAAYPIKDEEGETVKFVHVAKDITERKRAEARIRESEKKFRALLESAPDAIVIVNNEGRITLVNAQAERMFGFRRDELLGQPVEILVPEPLREAHVAHRAGYYAAPGTRPMGCGRELTARRKDGSELPVEVSLSTIETEGGLLVTSIIRDISERKQAQERIRKSEESYRELVENANDIVYSHDLKGRFTSVNGACERILGYTAEEVLNMDISQVVAPEHLDLARQMIRHKVEGGARTTYELEIIAKDGRRVPVEVSTRLILRGGKPVGVQGIARDISERKQAEKELRRLNQQIRKERQEIEELNRSLEERVRQRTEALRRANEELQERNRQLLDARAQATTDALTGLGNHRAFHERVREEVRRAQESGSPLGLIMLDIDSFKRINDSQGHLAGDDILRELALTIADVVRREDAYRYGGDEFAILLPAVDRRKATRVAERLRRAVERRVNGSGEAVTVSLGVAAFPDTAASAEELIYEADAAMYWAKSAGKNRVGDWRKLINRSQDGALPWYVADRGVRAPDVVAALLSALAAKDPVTSAHTERCSWYAARLAEELSLEGQDTSVVRLASLLHDIGKLAVPDEVLFKPGPLNEREWAQMKQHPTAALHVLGQVRSITEAIPAILHHHEHFDGSGYPDGLAGEEIPMASRILLVTDAFDAMTTDRPYRKAMSIEEAIAELKRCSGTQFDPAVVDAFLQILAREGARPLRRKTAARPQPTPAGTPRSRRRQGQA